MAKFFIDTEFIEKPNTIQLISIGIVAEDGRTYYAVSSGYNYNDADDWVKENVIGPIYNDFLSKFSEDYFYYIDDKNKKCFKSAYNVSSFHKENAGMTEIKKQFPIRTIKEIKEEILEFIYQSSFNDYQDRINKWNSMSGTVPIINYYYGDKDKDIFKKNPPEFYGYYSDYDWVVFCWIFGKMMDLPEGWPMYCKDLKQTMDELCEKNNCTIDEMKKHPLYPKQNNEHDTLDDAKWNKELESFLSNFTCEK